MAVALGALSTAHGHWPAALYFDTTFARTVLVRMALGIAAVGTDTPFVQSVLSSVEGYVRYFGGVTVIDSQYETFGE